MSDRREKIMNRIIAMRAKAGAGASEAEVQNALAMVSKLMQEYAIAEAEVARAAGIKVGFDVTHRTATSSPNKTRNSNHAHVVALLLDIIAKFTDTRITLNHHYGEIYIFGDNADIDMCDYIITLARTSLDAEYENYKRHNPVNKSSKKSFQIAMAIRLNARMKEVIAGREAARANVAAGSMELVVVEVNAAKVSEVSDYYDANAGNPRAAKSRKLAVRDANSYYAGMEAGDKISLHGGVEGGSVSLRIGN